MLSPITLPISPETVKSILGAQLAMPPADAETTKFCREQLDYLSNVTLNGILDHKFVGERPQLILIRLMEWRQYHRVDGVVIGDWSNVARATYCRWLITLANLKLWDVMRVEYKTCSEVISAVENYKQVYLAKLTAITQPSGIVPTSHLLAMIVIKGVEESQQSEVLKKLIARAPELSQHIQLGNTIRISDELASLW